MVRAPEAKTNDIMSKTNWYQSFNLVRRPHTWMSVAFLTLISVQEGGRRQNPAEKPPAADSWGLLGSDPPTDSPGSSQMVHLGDSWGKVNKVMWLLLIWPQRDTAKPDRGNYGERVEEAHPQKEWALSLCLLHFNGPFWCLSLIQLIEVIVAECLVGIAFFFFFLLQTYNREREAY